MKRISLLMVLALVSLGAFAQVKKPTIMVVPQDQWCISNGYFTESGGKKYSDYRAALQDNADLLIVISKLGEMMTERGFPLKTLESALKTVESQEMEDAVLISKDGGEVAETALDKIKKAAKADIVMQINWKVETSGPKKSVTFNLQGLDAYTDKQIAAASGTGAPAMASSLSQLLSEAVLAHIDQFNSQLQMHFDDMFENGREVALRIKVFDSWGEDLESEFGGSELSEIIENWVTEHAVRGSFNLSNATENMMHFEQVRIPLFNEKERPIDARAWARDLQKYLKSNYEIESKLMMQGLGLAQLVLGSK